MPDITIYEIAEEAGVSASTVSRVINGYPYIKKSTRNKVMKVLESRHFVPNESARDLVNRSTRMIGILIADIRTAHNSDGIFYVEQEFRKHGYSCLICNTGYEMADTVSYIQNLSQRKVEAVVLLGSIYQTHEVEEAIATYIPKTPVAIVSGSLQGDKVYGIMSNEKLGVMECVRFLVEKKRSCIAFGINHSSPLNLIKKEGYLEGMAKYAAASSPLVFETGKGVELMKESIAYFVKEHPEVDAYIFSEDFMGMIALQLFSEMGMAVPDQVSVIGINNSNFSKVSIPPMTTLDTKLYDTCQIAVHCLLDAIEGEHVSKLISIFTEIVERETT